MIWQYLNDISTNYVFGGSRYEPYNTDCSGIVCAGCYQVLGISPDELGTWTGAQWKSALLDTIWQGTMPDLPYEIMREDDFIFTSTESPLFDTGDGSHVGLYTGDAKTPFLSHFADGGPYITAVNAVYGGRERFYGVRRLKVMADIRPADVWEYNYENTAPFGNMYNTAVQTNLFTQDIKRDIERLNERLDVIEKKLDAMIEL